ncbi:MAG: hypothetical protein ACREUE_15635 [Panacagrimonas sp.]
MMALTAPDWLAPVGFWAAAGALVAVLLRQIGPWRKQITETEEHLRRELVEANDALSDKMAAMAAMQETERAASNARIEKLERRLEKQQLRHNAERALDRHRLNNVTQCLDSLLLLIEMSPDRAAEVVAKIKEMRAAQMFAEAEEKAIIRAAEITADGGEADHDGN